MFYNFCAWKLQNFLNRQTFVASSLALFTYPAYRPSPIHALAFTVSGYIWKISQELTTYFIIIFSLLTWQQVFPL